MYWFSWLHWSSQRLCVSLRLYIHGSGMLSQTQSPTLLHRSSCGSSFARRTQTRQTCAATASAWWRRNELSRCPPHQCSNALWLRSCLARAPAARHSSSTLPSRIASSLPPVDNDDDAGETVTLASTGVQVDAEVGAGETAT